MIPVLARSAERAADDPQERAQGQPDHLGPAHLVRHPAAAAHRRGRGGRRPDRGPAQPGERQRALRPRRRGRGHQQHARGVRAPDPAVRAVGRPLRAAAGVPPVRRPALGPAISSLVVISAYLAFAPAGPGLPLSRLPVTAELILSVGTTLGVAALVVVAVWPTWRLHLPLRPALRFPPGVARRAGGLALVGVDRARRHTTWPSWSPSRWPTGAARPARSSCSTTPAQVFNSVAAVLALSVVISAFPVLSARDGPVFDRTCAGSTRAVLLLSWLGTAVIAAIAVPAAHVLARQPDRCPQLIDGVRLVRARASSGIGRDREPVPGDARPRAAEGRGRRRWPGSWLLVDRGRRGAGRARPGPPGGGRAGAGQHHRPDAWWPSRW